MSKYIFFIRLNIPFVGFFADQPLMHSSARLLCL